MANVAKLENGLTPQQHDFVKAILAGSRPSDAATRARFAEPSVAAYRLMHLPAVQVAIHQGVQRKLQQEAAASLNVLIEIRDDAKAPARVRADVGKWLLNLAGHVAPTTRGDGTPEKQLAEMSPDELHAYIERNQKEIDRLEGELAARAKDVSAPHSAPNTPLIEAKPLSYLE